MPELKHYTEEEKTKLVHLHTQAVLAERKVGYVRPVDYRSKPIDYIDPAPKPLITQISLVEYWERMTRWKADPWQVDLGNRLQKAAEIRHIRGCREIFHAEPQIGKTVWISQHLPAWLFGHDPLFRFALAMYNTAQSEKHSKAVIRILSSPLHKDIFPNKDGWLYGDQGQKSGRPVQAAVSGWYTNAGQGVASTPGNAGQFSFNPVGLVSGLTGSGFDWLVGDDPYRSEKDAFSPTVNESIRDFLDFLESRISLTSNLSLMFHRYAYDDAAAYLLDKGDFNYVRYATQCDGDYIHPNTGERFTDPINREIGEYISPRRGEAYYSKVKKNPRVWSSMNQGRPVAQGTEFFLVDKIRVRPSIDAHQCQAECALMVRAWDLAATERAGDYSVAPLMGMRPDKTAVIFETVREQVESAGRDRLMLKTAQRDGFDVVISIPEDPAAAGKTAVYHIQQLLQGYQVVVRSTTGSKEDRARSYASAVNSGDIEFISDDDLGEDAKWVEPTKKEMREFLQSALTHDDTIDSGADAYNECFERISKGLVIKNFRPQRNLVPFSSFAEMFTPPGSEYITRIPAQWTRYIGVKITPEASRANSALIVARAPRNSGLGETLFIVAEYREFTDDFSRLFNWIDGALDAYCEGKEAVIYLHPQSSVYQRTLWQKHKIPIRQFDGDAMQGLTELNWYLTPTDEINPFSTSEKGTRLYGIIWDDNQLSVAADDLGLHAVRQEAATWGYTDKGVPSEIGSVVDCLRMLTYGFRTVATPLNSSEKLLADVPTYMQEATDEQTLVAKQMWLQREMKEREDAERRRKGGMLGSGGNPIDAWKKASGGVRKGEW